MTTTTEESTPQETLETTSEIRLRLRTVMELRKAVSMVSKPMGLFKKKIDHEAVTAVSKAEAEATHQLWETIALKYPQTKTGTWNCSCEKITKVSD